MDALGVMPKMRGFTTSALGGAAAIPARALPLTRPLCFANAEDFRCPRLEAVARRKHRWSGRVNARRCGDRIAALDVLQDLYQELTDHGIAFGGGG